MIYWVHSQYREIFVVLLNKSKSSCHVLKLVEKTFAVYLKIHESAKGFSLESACH